MWIVYRPWHRCSFYKRFKTSWRRHIGHVVCVWWETFPVPVSPPSPIKFLYPYKTEWLSVLVSSVQKPSVLCVTIVSCCTLGQSVHNTIPEALRLTGTAAKPGQTCNLFDRTGRRTERWWFLEALWNCQCLLTKSPMCNVAFVYAGLKAKKSL